MKVDEFDYELPSERIAQRPPPDRERSRLMLLDRRTGRTEHREFSDLVDELDQGDLLVLNDTRVIPARLVGTKGSGGRVELLLVEARECHGSVQTWEVLIRASRLPKPGDELHFGEISARVTRCAEGTARVELRAERGSVSEALRQVGQIPLPPYIRREPGSDDRNRYQTVYALRDGAVAAPTAGLHFTRELLDRLGRRGVNHVMLTLHVGPGTFQPVRVESVEDHRMQEERYDLPAATVHSIEQTRRNGGRIVAVGTTVVRTLEGCAAETGTLRAGQGRCDLFIYPGYRFRTVDALITNFHLPRSTLLMLVAAFAGRERLMTAYREALSREYRFFSYGDAMFIRSGR